MLNRRMEIKFVKWKGFWIKQKKRKNENFRLVILQLKTIWIMLNENSLQNISTALLLLRMLEISVRKINKRFSSFSSKIYPWISCIKKLESHETDFVDFSSKNVFILCVEIEEREEQTLCIAGISELYQQNTCAIIQISLHSTRSKLRFGKMLILMTTIELDFM